MAPGFPTREHLAARYAERSGRDLGRARLLRRPRLLEAGDHPRGRLRPLRRRPVRRVGEGFEQFAKIVERLADGRRGRRLGASARRLAGWPRAPSRRPRPRFAQRFSSRRAITILWTSSGPSAIRSMRLKRHITASGVSSVIPSAAVDLDRAVEHVHDHVGGDDLDHRDLAGGRRACPRCPSSRRRSRVSSRAWSTSIRDLAMKSWMNCLSASGAAERLARVGAAAHHLDRPLGGADRAHAVVDAARAEAVLGDHEARPRSGPSRLAAGTRQSS